MQDEATSAQKENWRFDEALYRSYTDAYERHRFIAATAREQRALSDLGNSPRLGSNHAMQAASLNLIPDPARTATLLQLRNEIETLAGLLFHNIGLQLSVKKYGAAAIDRGASLDTVDVELNDRAWLEQQFLHIRTLNSEPERLQAIADILNWGKPGAGSFYDDLGKPSAEPHIVRGPVIRPIRLSLRLHLTASATTRPIQAGGSQRFHRLALYTTTHSRCAIPALARQHDTNYASFTLAKATRSR